MGELDEEERQYLLIDKDTGRVYDLRNDTHLQRITSKNTRLTVDMSANNISTPRIRVRHSPALAAPREGTLGVTGGSRKREIIRICCGLARMATLRR
jgi:hypothetical protein